MESEYNNPTPPKQKKSIVWKILLGIILFFSVLANLVMVVILVSTVAIFTAGSTGGLMEEMIESGPRTNKIAVIRLEGIINREMADDIIEQIESAQKDKNVKALIIRTFTPGGSVFASDRIHNQIMKFRQGTSKPVVAFMEGLAASGGYYTSVACDKIIAEPTTITGSIGVIMGHFVLQELLEEKLGIQPVVIKSGLKKDWPSSFSEVTAEQKEYLQNKLIGPAYERFVLLIAQGRVEQLTPEEIRLLADGSIYNATEAMNNGLIDEIGYIDDAIELAKTLAGIEKAYVVEYKRPFSLTSWLDSKTEILPRLDRTGLYELTTPQLMYIWHAEY